MSLAQAHLSQTTDVSSSSSSETKVRILGRPLLCMGLQQVFEGTNFIVSDPSLHGPALKLPCKDVVSELFVLDGKYCTDSAPKMILELKSLHPESRIVLLTDQLDPSAVLATHDAGADGILLASSSRDVLLHSIQLVMLGEVVVSSELIVAFINPFQDGGSHVPAVSLEKTHCLSHGKPLSNREMEVLGWLREGAPNKVIARELNLAEATIKVHVKSILKKISVGNRAQAAIWAAQHLLPEASLS